MATVMTLARQERADFADFLATLTPQQWDSPTLCGNWRVHDVVAHVISYDPLSIRELVGRMARGLATKGGANAIGVAEFSVLPPEDLVALIRRHAEPRGLTTGFGGRIALTDGLIHQQDIRRPLGLPRQIPAERLCVTLDFARWAPPIRGGLRARGTRMVATDLDWSAGRGPEVRGPGEALLMVMAGRCDAVADLAGPGLPRLERRLRPRG
ncbi:maleylpyruvate isomerase family mycothiol-dependent enzyme [Mycolicibacterium sp. HK-90]|uniref:maleylpyruvate isomerase family mycothiol-dependent enzyme n=1 Tax=Mycolicibacterium sp. HK-90 TaxID=3056937 RepID=UPI0026591D98|nr:maleylpyruvate isomerase family mycothiol-dependent enzyme [Mycolicibacterium sp. HK-90]WKG01579.1 maleylpyruvate isomerase family mycothiol-dependent enzyme [Mycolicibacterium sp. HK-90]